MAASSTQRKAMQARVNPRSTSTKAGSVVLSISMVAMVVLCCPQTGAYFQLPFSRGFYKCKGEEGRIKHKTEGAKGHGTKTYPCFKCHEDMHKCCTVLPWLLQEDNPTLCPIRVSSIAPYTRFSVHLLLQCHHCDYLGEGKNEGFESLPKKENEELEKIKHVVADTRVYFTSLAPFQHAILLASETLHQLCQVVWQICISSLCVSDKIHTQPELWEVQFTVKNLHFDFLWSSFLWHKSTSTLCHCEMDVPYFILSYI